MAPEFLEEKATRQRKGSKLVHEGENVAEVEVTLIDEDDGWSPYLSVEDTKKLDCVRKALRRRDLTPAATFGRVYALTPIAS